MEGDHLRSGMLTLVVLTCLWIHTDAWYNKRGCSGRLLPKPNATYTFKDISYLQEIKSSYRAGVKVVYACAHGLEKQSGSRVVECKAYHGWVPKGNLHCAARTTQKTTTQKPVLTTSTQKPVMTTTTKKPVMPTQTTTTEKPVLLLTTPAPAFQEVQALGTTARPPYEELMTSGVMTTSGSALPGDLDPHGATQEEDGSTVYWPAILGGCGGSVVLILIILSIVLYCKCKRHRRSRNRRPSETEENPEEADPLNSPSHIPMKSTETAAEMPGEADPLNPPSKSTKTTAETPNL